MANIDEILKTKGARAAGSSGSGGSDMDDFLKETEKLKVQEAKQASIDEIIAEKRKNAALHDKERMLLVRSDNPLDAAVAVSPNAQSALLKTLIDSGTDPKKAADFLKEVDDTTLARIMVLSGNSSGMSSLLPLLLIGKQPQTTVKDMLEVATTIHTLSTPRSEGGFKEYTDAFATVADILEKRKGGEEDSSIREEIAAMRQSLDAEREARHQSEIEHQKEVAEIRQGQLQDQLGGIQQELESLKNRDLGSEVEKAKATLEKLGFKIGTGEREDLDTLKEITKMVVESPAVEGLSSAVGDRIRSGAGMRGPRQVAGPQSTVVFCDVCAQRGVKTPLTVTPEIAAGKADLVCPVCGTTFSKG